MLKEVANLSCYTRYNSCFPGEGGAIRELAIPFSEVATYPQDSGLLRDLTLIKGFSVIKIMKLFGFGFDFILK